LLFQNGSVFILQGSGQGTEALVYRLVQAFANGFGLCFAGEFKPMPIATQGWGLTS